MSRICTAAILAALATAGLATGAPPIIGALSPATAAASAAATLAPSAMQSLPAFAPTSIWTSPVNSVTAVDPASSSLVASLNAYVQQEITGRYGPWLNTTKYSVPVYTVPANQPLVTVTLDRLQPYAATLKSAFAAGVPIPAGAQPAAGTDEHMVVWQPSTDTMWEFWKMTLQSGAWHAQWGGKMTHVSTNPGYFNGKANSGINEPLWGATATSIPLVAGLITPAELQAGVINHALALAIPESRARTWASPAQRTDGSLTTAASIPEGSHFRIDPALNLNALNLPPLTLILATAAQKYGIIVRDKSGTVTFYGQDPTPTGSNPYPAFFGNKMPSVPLASFPWSHLQLLPMTLH